MDFIHINEMQFYGYHGALAEETVLGQRFTISVTLAADLQQAGRTDDLSATVNYAEVYETVRSIAEGEPVKLIETVAERVAAKLLTDYQEQVSGVRVKVVKPDPPIPGHYASVAVEVERGQLR
ncbi:MULTISPECIES: dihydroneopterin aldolase [Sporosarcina]|uniref:dihydroneopterin aldolase n=1 Tax=Sporosarcina TaxID=1569 RepID=UPI00058AC76B|nr:MULTISPECIES: dihydroneopterin aldolase [Sporosarcina]WJY26708.1 dihydroneopterin aldolase [Sporosarcina sp. 0.2-SM1T-5]